MMDTMSRLMRPGVMVELLTLAAVKHRGVGVVKGVPMAYEVRAIISPEVVMRLMPKLSYAEAHVLLTNFFKEGEKDDR